jgi:hypothetical protein
MVCVLIAYLSLLIAHNSSVEILGGAIVLGLGAVCAISSAVGLLSACAVPGARRAQRAVSVVSERAPHTA